MAWETKKEGENEKIYYVDDDDPIKKSLVFDVNKANQKIIFYPKDGTFFLKEIFLDGFADVPEEIIKSGTFRSGLMYFLNSRLAGKKILSLTVSNKEKSSLKKVSKGKNIIFSDGDITNLIKKLGSIYHEASVERGEYVDSFLFGLYPGYFPKVDAVKSARNKARRLIKNLETDTIDQLKTSEAQKLVDYFVEMIEKRSTQQKFFNLAKLKIDEVSLDSVISKIKSHILNNAVENEWSNFLIENLFVVDSKYTYAIPEINLTLGGSRRVDFGLIDSDGYLDIFEIKRPNTKIFEKDPDHGNYYWHKNAVQAIVQAEKYLNSANRKGAQLVEDLQRERGVDIPFKIIKPRAFLIMGTSEQFTNKHMADDFQVLRRSQKNIEIILYDDFLKKLENQKNKVFLVSNTEKADAIELAKRKVVNSKKVKLEK